MLADVVRILRGLNPPGYSATLADVLTFLKTYTANRKVIAEAKADPSLAAELHAEAAAFPEPS
jgi:hypothetical protein